MESDRSKSREASEGRSICRILSHLSKIPHYYFQSLDIFLLEFPPLLTMALEKIVGYNGQLTSWVIARLVVGMRAICKGAFWGENVKCPGSAQQAAICAVRQSRWNVVREQ